MDNDTCLETTHSWGDEMALNLRYDTRGFIASSQEHLLILHFATCIRVSRLVIVTDQELNERNIWREIPTYKKHTITQERPEITITLLLSEKFNNKLVPFTCQSPPPAISRERLRILHDARYLLNPATSRLELSFKCTGDYITLTDDERIRGYIHAIISSIRIFPIYSTIQRHIIHPLPAEAIRRIGVELIFQWDDVRVVSCFQRLTTCALVCKAWYNSGVNNLLWMDFFESSNDLCLEDDYFSRFVGCVERYPSIGERLLLLPCPTFHQREVKEFRAEYGVLMKSAINLRRLNLMKSQWDLVRGYLPPLRHIKYAKLGGGHGSTDGLLGVYEMLEVINQWTSLVELRVETWELELQAEIPRVPATFELHELVLSGGRSDWYIGDQPRFLSLRILEHLLSRPDSLRVLVMACVTGLSQGDFRVIFSLIKSTITMLLVDVCTLVPDSTDEHGEYAFDAVVNKMPHLESVRLTLKGHGLTSSLGILRKKASGNGLHGDFEASWRLGPNDTLQDLENALRCTGWKKVIILARWGDKNDFAVAKKIASSRGMRFEVKY